MHLCPRESLGVVDGYPSHTAPTTPPPRKRPEEASPRDGERGLDGEMTLTPLHETAASEGRLRLFGPLPGWRLGQAPMPAKTPMWMEVMAFEQRSEQQIAHEQMERNKIQVAAHEAAQLLERSEQTCAALRQEVADREKAAADSRSTIERLTLRLQGQEERAAEETKAQAEQLQAKADELSGTLAIAQQRLNDCEESGKELANRLQDSERSRQAGLASHSQDKDDMQKVSQARFDEQARQHDLALKSVWQQHSDLQARLARKEAEHCESQQLAAGLRAELEQMEVDYKKALGAIAQALKHPLMEKMVET